MTPKEKLEQIHTNDLEAKGEITALLQYANGVTGEADTRLGDAMYRLADGYWQGGGGIEPVFTADFVTTEETAGKTITIVLPPPRVEQFAGECYLCILKYLPGVPPADGKNRCFVRYQLVPTNMGNPTYYAGFAVGVDVYVNTSGTITVGQYANKNALFVSNISTPDGGNKITISDPVSTTYSAPRGAWRLTAYKFKDY